MFLYGKLNGNELVSDKNKGFYDRVKGRLTFKGATGLSILQLFFGRTLFLFRLFGRCDG